MNNLDIFYNEIIREAATGRVDCFLMYNILFETKIIEDNIHIKSDNDNLLVPTLVISNKNKFNELLLEYVELAKNFYDLSKIENELNDKDNINNVKIDKVIMTLLWSNATIEDFNNPIEFLRRRISFLKDTKLLKYNNVNLGYSSTLKSNINISIEKDSIYNEAPYNIKIKLVDENNKDNVFYFPDVRIGIDNDTAYIYAIQNNKQYKNDNVYSKKINRLLFKIGENFINDQDDLKDVTSSFIVSSNIVLSILESIGINKILIPTILISRWNSKIISDNIRGVDKEENYIEIQKNLTDKFIRTFRRIEYHNKNIQIDSYPFELDSYLHLSFNKELSYVNNKLLDETYNFKTK